MKSIQTVENEIIEAFQALPSVDEKYAYLFNVGEDLPPFDTSLKNDANLVRGCQSQLWFHIKADEGRLFISADSDSMVIKGIAALLMRLVDGRAPAEVEKVNLDFIDQIEIWKLASERNNGLVAMLDHVKRHARALAAEGVRGQAHHD